MRASSSGERCAPDAGVFEGALEWRGVRQRAERRRRHARVLLPGLFFVGEAGGGLKPPVPWPASSHTGRAAIANWTAAAVKSVAFAASSSNLDGSTSASYPMLPPVPLSQCAKRGQAGAIGAVAGGLAISSSLDRQLRREAQRQRAQTGVAGQARHEWAVVIAAGVVTAGGVLRVNMCHGGSLRGGRGDGWGDGQSGGRGGRRKMGLNLLHELVDLDTLPRPGAGPGRPAGRRCPWAWCGSR